MGNMTNLDLQILQIWNAVVITWVGEK
jgi:hypothetical protein